MKLKQQVMEHAFCMPRGTLGRIGGWLMARDRELPAWVLDLLDITPFHSLLEVGVGPGVGLELAATRAHAGRIVGIDASETMLEVAYQRNRERIEAGRVELHLGTVDQLVLDDRTFDAAMILNSLHVWPDPVASLRTVRRMLRADGRIAVGFSRFSDVAPDRFERSLHEAGFVNVTTHRGDKGMCTLGWV